MNLGEFLTNQRIDGVHFSNGLFPVGSIGEHISKITVTGIRFPVIPHGYQPD